MRDVGEAPTQKPIAFPSSDYTNVLNAKHPAFVVPTPPKKGRRYKRTHYRTRKNLLFDPLKYLKPGRVDVADSVRPDGIVSMLNGKIYKNMTLHIYHAGLTPDSYRSYYGLPDHYPVVCEQEKERLADRVKAFRRRAT